MSGQPRVRAPSPGDSVDNEQAEAGQNLNTKYGIPAWQHVAAKVDNILTTHFL